MAVVVMAASNIFVIICGLFSLPWEMSDMIPVLHAGSVPYILGDGCFLLASDWGELPLVWRDWLMCGEDGGEVRKENRRRDKILYVNGGKIGARGQVVPG